MVRVGSTAGSRSMTNARVAHTVTKGGVVALTKQLAAEGAPLRDPRELREPRNDRDPGHPRRPACPWTIRCRDRRSHPFGGVGQPPEVARSLGSWRATRRRTSPGPTWSSTVAGRRCSPART